MGPYRPAAMLAGCVPCSPQGAGAWSGAMGWRCSSVGYGVGSEARRGAGGLAESTCPLRRARSGAELGSSTHSSEFWGVSAHGQGKGRDGAHSKGVGGREGWWEMQGGPWPHHPHGLSFSISPPRVQLLPVLRTPPGQGAPMQPPPSLSSFAGIVIALLQQVAVSITGTFSKACGLCQPGGLGSPRPPQLGPVLCERGGQGCPSPGFLPVPWPSPPPGMGGCSGNRSGHWWEPPSALRCGFPQAAAWVLWPCWQQQAVA